jgi:hypothetical protein
MTMPVDRIPKTKICLGCASLDVSVRKDALVCNNCGFSFTESAYNEIVKYAAHVTRYGHQYKKAFARADEEYKRTGRRIDYYLTTSDVLTFAALAVLSGIIGNTAHELVKAALSAIRDSIAKDRALSQRISQFLNLEEEQQVKEFMDNIQYFDRELPQMGPKRPDAQMFKEIWSSLSSAHSEVRPTEQRGVVQPTKIGDSNTSGSKPPAKKPAKPKSKSSRKSSGQKKRPRDRTSS